MSAERPDEAGTEAPIEKLGDLRQVILSVDDVPAATKWVQEALGLPLRFTDGERYAAFDAGSVTLALAAPDDQVGSGATSIAIRVGSISAARERLTSAGSAPGPDEVGRHEVRMPFTAPGGAQFVAYAPAATPPDT